MPVHASQMYARNIANLLALIVTDGELRLDFNDEIVARRLRHARRAATMRAERR